MTPEEIPAELKSILDEDAGKEHSATGAVMTSLARILARHREMVLEEADDAFKRLQVVRRADRIIDEATTRLMIAYRDMITAAGLSRTPEALKAERQLDRLTCQCCAFGNHNMGCICDGEGCCHPEQYEECFPGREHGGDWSQA